MHKNNVSLDILAHGKPMREFAHEGKTFVESREGSEYSLRIKNHSSQRTKAVISVDGLNIIDGKPCSDDPNQTGYILGAYEEHIIKGYRVDGETVAQFKFVKREASYATETGNGAGNGVIAVRVYAEKENLEDKVKMWKDLYEKERNRPKEKEYVPYPARPWYWEDEWYRPYPRPYFGGMWCGGYSKTTTCDNMMLSTANNVVNTTASLSSAQASYTAGAVLCAASLDNAVQTRLADENPFSMGSAWGNAVKDSVKEVAFEVGKLVAEISIYYTTLNGLKALGVNVDKVKAVAFPEPFKREYCTVPSGWKR